MNHQLKPLQDLLDEYARAIGLNSLQLDENGRCGLWFDDKFSVTIEYSPENEAVVFFSELGGIPPDRELELCRLLLEANHFWRHTGGLGTLSLAPENPEHPESPRVVVMLYQTPLQVLDSGTFQSRLNDFADTAEAWMDYLAQGQESPYYEPVESAPQFEDWMLKV